MTVTAMDVLMLPEFFFFFCLVIFIQFNKSAEGRNPYTREVYKRTPKWDKKRISLKSLHK